MRLLLHSELAHGLQCRSQCRGMRGASAARPGVIQAAAVSCNQPHEFLHLHCACIRWALRRPADRRALSCTGTAEASGYYCDAAGRIRNQDTRNHRILLDTFLVGPTLHTCSTIALSGPDLSCMLLHTSKSAQCQQH